MTRSSSTSRASHSNAGQRRSRAAPPAPAAARHRRGQLIAIEGIDGAGTTTQARQLIDWMRAVSLPAALTWEPSSGKIGQLLRALLAEGGQAMPPAAVGLLFAADRLEHVQHEIEPLLASGNHVITDRYVYSSLAYQSVLVEESWVATINALAPEPDLTVYIRVSAAVARERRAVRGAPDELFDADELQAAICAKYDELLGSSMDGGSWRLDPARGWLRNNHGSAWIPTDRCGSSSPSPWHGRTPVTAVLDGARPIEAIQNELRMLVKTVCGASPTLPGCPG